MNISMKRLEITTKIGCTLNCRFCPQDVLLKAYGAQERPRTLSFNSFRQLLNHVDKNVMICFAGMSEPWGNPACSDMVEYAAKKGYPVAVYTTLMGWTDSDYDRLKDIHFEEFVIHLPDENENTKMCVTPTYLNLLGCILQEDRSKNLQVTGFSCHGDIDPRVVPHIPKKYFVSTELNDRAGNISGTNMVASGMCNGQMLCIRCADRLDQNILLPDGSVLLCCMDYGMKHVLGNLYKETYAEILESEEAQHIRNAMRIEGDPILCRKCINAKDIYALYDTYQEYYTWAFSLYEEQNKLK